MTTKVIVFVSQDTMEVAYTCVPENFSAEGHEYLGFGHAHCDAEDVKLEFWVKNN